MILKAISAVAFAALLLTGPATSVPSVPASEASATVQTTAPTQAPATEMTAQEAAAIALTHAGLTEADVTNLRTRLEKDDGVLFYEVKFCTETLEYEYEIHAISGRILDREAEPRPAQKPEKEPGKPDKDETAPVQPALTAQEAEAIALAHAGLTAEELTCLHTKFDVDDGVAQWEVEFRAGNREYDYTIHAETGKVLEWDWETESCEECRKKDKDHGNKQEKPQPPAQEGAAAPTLTAEEAEAIALAHAGLTAEQVTRLRSEFDRDDGVAQWEVEFRVGQMEYEYTIHAETGKILEWDKEIDD